ncbi:tetratricopeptide repeat protein [Ktedonobacteria bacterium brp13]|nr:tetratricopeptide repeat protein [Ktedonobacteria bacterium brp13]
MAQNTDSEMLLYRARLLVEEGRYDAAVAVLETVHPAGRQRLEVAYLLGWCYVQRKQWVEACVILEPILGGREPGFYVLGFQGKELERQDFQSYHLQERELQALTLLLLGLGAINMAMYEDASFHLTHCLKVLHDRRVHLPRVRIYARFSLAMTCLMRGLYTQSIQHYEEALRLCSHYADEEAVPDIHHGLCDVYRSRGDLVKSYAAGKDALRLYEERGDQQMIARMHSMLGRVCLLLQQYQAAADHYMLSQAIALAGGGTTLVMVNYAALAEVYLAEQRPADARHYGQLALTAMKQSSDLHMSGRVYLIIGKIAHEEARHASGDERQSLLNTAVSWYTQANACLETTQAYSDMAELYDGWGQALEDLGRVAEAIQCWRAGFAMLHESRSVSQPLNSLLS